MHAFRFQTLLLSPLAGSCLDEPGHDIVAHDRGRDVGGCRRSLRDRDWP